jgi:DNA polymerase III epsilon subunit-like protein
MKKYKAAFGGNFKKDILLIDTEFTGFDINKHELLQLAGVLLDKKTLKEKKHFNSFVRPTPARWKHREKDAMAVNRITLEQIKDAPTLKEVIRKFDKTFGHNVIQAAYVGYNDKRFLTDSYKRAGVKWQFDYHFFDIWGLFYGFLAARNMLTSKKNFSGFGMEMLMKHFKIEIPTTLHDALTDCRCEAEVLRRVMQEL